jgi:hypothetical protein
MSRSICCTDRRHISNATGRPEARGSYRHGHVMTSTANVNSSLGESEISLRMCGELDCKTKGHNWNENCYCCFTKPDVPCWHTMAECHANCPPCNPKCGSKTATELHVWRKGIRMCAKFFGLCFNFISELPFDVYFVLFDLVYSN